MVFFSTPFISTHIYTTTEPGGECTIVGDKNGLLRLAETIKQAASSDTDWRKLYSGDGHEYTVLVAKESDQDVWANLELPYSDPVFKESRSVYIQPESLETVQMYHENKHKL